MGKTYFIADLHLGHRLVRVCVDSLIRQSMTRPSPSRGDSGSVTTMWSGYSGTATDGTPFIPPAAPALSRCLTSLVLGRTRGASRRPADCHIGSARPIWLLLAGVLQAPGASDGDGSADSDGSLERREHSSTRKVGRLVRTLSPHSRRPPPPAASAGAPSAVSGVRPDGDRECHL